MTFLLKQIGSTDHSVELVLVHALLIMKLSGNVKLPEKKTELLLLISFDLFKVNDAGGHLKEERTSLKFLFFLNFLLVQFE